MASRAGDRTPRADHETARPIATNADLLASDRLPETTCRIATARIASALRLNVEELRRLVDDLRGPLPNRSAERHEQARRREELWQWLANQVHDLSLDDWVARLRTIGIPAGDIDAHRCRLAGVVAVLRRLPADGVALPALAADTLSDPHALDHGTWIGRAVVEAIAIMQRHSVPRTAEDGRNEWGNVGVAADMLSPVVLTLGLRPNGESSVSEMLRSLSSDSEPATLTLSQLRRWPLHLDAQPGVTYLFENPSILAEAARGAWGGPPLVCTSGWPNVAVITLLRQMQACEWELRIHCDFDPKGVQIARWLSERVGARPWRMQADDYLAAIDRSSIRITAPIPDTPWDIRLSETMRSRQQTVFEEDIRESLLTAIQHDPL